MAQRMTEIAADRVRRAIEALQLPQAVKDRLQWDVIQAATPMGLFFVPLIGMKVAGTADDYATAMARPPGLDVNIMQAEWDSAIRQLADAALADADARAVGIAAAQNGSGKKSPGGLHLP